MSEKIQDFGTKIGGARKDFGKKALSINDLAHMNDLERKKYVLKKNIWKPLDYQRMKDDNFSPECTSYIKRVKDSIPTTCDNIEEIQKEYITFINEIKDVLLLEKEDLENLAKKTKIFFYEKYTVDAAGKKYNDLAKKHGKHAVINYEMLSKIKLSQRYGNYGGYEGINYSWDNLIKDKKKIQVEKSKPQKPKKPYLSEVKRAGKKWLNADVESSDIQDTFKFRAGEFGNWLSQKERQQSLNSSYEALKDLAQVLNLDNNKIGLNGTLAVAFGSRGSGNAMAHYEAERVVINLTKIRGAGSLAHEWFHAMDNFLGKTYLSEDDIFLTSFIKENKNLDKLNQELVNSIKKLITVIYSKSVTEEQKKVYQDGVPVLKNYLQSIEGINHTYQESKVIDGIKYHIEQIENEKYINKEASFYQEALILDNKKDSKYWSDIKELAARAFEAYILDKIEISDYLVAFADEKFFADKTKWEANPYPVGAERQNINKAFDDFFEVIRKINVL